MEEQGGSKLDKRENGWEACDNSWEKVALMQEIKQEKRRIRNKMLEKVELKEEKKTRKSRI